MPPSPAMRCSPGREPRPDNHKRGRSFENEILLKPRDDDLALFNEVQNRERDNFLLQSNDDFEDTFTNKLRHFSDHKLGINIPARGESSDLLHAEEEKNDYEWLLTPPDTPLFPSLDEETSEANIVRRGRPRTQPISISRSSTMEKSHRSSRGSASPNRFSPSPRSSHSPFEARNRASPTPSCSPPASLRPTSSTRRLSPPSRKPATPVPRASTPTPRRSSTGSNGTTGLTTGRTKTTRGNSASPKVIAWQSNIPGFSTEVPPNLRTSLADRPASYVRGSSPASRSSRQSMSPTPSRSICSSRSKGSVASSVEDDVESIPSVIVGSVQRPGSRRAGGFLNNKGLVSKRPSRTVSSSSAPKRSFDLALRQMDHQKGPQNMFRPLLSSVPSSSFHVGITSSAPHAIASRNSSITTSSNASSGLGTSTLHEPETSHDDATSARVNLQECSTIDDEVFMLKKDKNESFDESDHDNGVSVVFDDARDDGEKGVLICSRCGCGYDLIGGVENDENLCVDCARLDSRLTFVDPGVEAGVVESLEVRGKVKGQLGQQDGQTTYGESIWEFLPESSLSRSRSEECAPKNDKVDCSNSKFDFSGTKVDSSYSQVDSPGSKADLLNSKVDSMGSNRSEESPLKQVGDDKVDFSNSKFDFSGTKHDSLDSKVDSPGSKVDSMGSNIDLLSSKVDTSGDFANSKGDVLYTNVDFSGLKVDCLKSEVDSLEGAGISVLLKRSNSIKGSVVRNTYFSASSISYDDFSYARDSTNSMRSMSVSSSVDFGPVKQTDTRFSRQVSSAKSEMENYKFDLGSSLSGTSSHACHTSSLSTSIENDENTLQTVSNQTHIESGESFEDGLFQKVEDSGVNACALQTCTCEEGTTPNLCVDNLDIPEVSLEVISEGELKCDDSSNHESNIIEESTVLVKAEGGLNGRSLTLEEATDTILFCSSIVHKLAYEAATIAIENQNPPDPVDQNPPDPVDQNPSWPLVPATRKNHLELKKRVRTKQSLKSQKSQHKKVAEPDTMKPDNEGQTGQPKTRIVTRDSGNLESKKPPILESKCNCTIM